MVEAGYREEILEQLADFFEFAPVGMIAVDRGGRARRMNIAALELIGGFDARGEVIGRPLVERFMDDATHRRIVEQISAGRIAHHVPATLRCIDGGQVEVILDANARIEGGEVQSSRWFVRPARPRELPTARAVAASPDVIDEIGEMSQAERLAALEELNDFFDNAPVGVHFVGLNGVILRANRAEVDLLGYSDAPEGYIGRHVRNIHHERAVVETLLERLVAGTPVIAHEAYLRKKNGELQAVHIYSGLRLKEGKFQNTRCFLFENPSPSRPPTASHVAGFSWPRDAE